MIESIKADRKGWIKILTMIEKMVGLVGQIYNQPNKHRCLVAMNCEDDRAKKIEKKFVELEELIWEATAVSEKVLSEAIKRNPIFADDPDFFEHDPFNEKLHHARNEFYKAAKELSELALSIYDDKATEVVEPEVVYPGGVAGSEEPKEDPRQMKLGLAKPEPPQVDPSKLLDYKKQQANDVDEGDQGEDGE